MKNIAKKALFPPAIGNVDRIGHYIVQGISIRPFPGCEKAAGKLRQKGGKQQ